MGHPAKVLFRKRAFPPSILCLGRMPAAIGGVRPPPGFPLKRNRPLYLPNRRILLPMSVFPRQYRPKGACGRRRLRLKMHPRGDLRLAKTFLPPMHWRPSILTELRPSQELPLKIKHPLSLPIVCHKRLRAFCFYFPIYTNVLQMRACVFVTSWTAKRRFRAVFLSVTEDMC